MAFWTGGPHATSGLEGYPARDFGAPGGTPVYAWETLRVERISGAAGYRGDGFGGFNLYLKDRTGKQYFMTHVEGLRAKVGDVLRPGQQVAAVGNYGTPHVHLGYQGGDPVTVLSFKPEFLFTPGGAVAGSSVVQDRSRLPVVGRDKPQVAGIPLPLIPGGIGGTTVTPGSIAIGRGTVAGISSVADLVRWIGSNWDRIAEVAAGFLVLLIGLVLMGRSMGVTKSKIEIVEGRLPGGMQRQVEREAARAEASSYRREAARSGRRRAGAPAPRRRTVALPSGEPGRKEPRQRRTGGAGPSEDIPF